MIYVRHTAVVGTETIETVRVYVVLSLTVPVPVPVPVTVCV